MKKIVVTGGLGHIGSRLIRTLLVLPHTQVSIIDNLATQRYASIFNLPKGRTHFTEADIVTADLPRLFRGADAVVHLAAMTDAAASFADPVNVEAINYRGTRRVAQAAAHVGARLFFPSTTSVYGTNTPTIDEDGPTSDIQPQSPYAASKRKAERLLTRLARTDDLKFMVARFGTICGPSPGMRFHTAVNRFCWQANLGLPLTVWRTAWQQRRPYLDLGDAVRVIIYAIQHDLFDGRIYNAVTDNLTVAEVCTMLRRYLPRTKVRLIHAPIMNDWSYSVAPTRLSAAGFTFRGSIERAIADTLKLLQGIRH